jgi:molybdopterin synthase catalytic subunit
MKFDIKFTPDPIVVPEPPADAGVGAWLEFRGFVRGDEAGAKIAGLRYEIYHAMAERVLRDIITDIAREHPVTCVIFIHREGVVRVGECPVYVGVASRHRGEGIRFLETLMNRLKQDVPIWKAEVIV